MGNDQEQHEQDEYESWEWFMTMGAFALVWLLGSVAAALVWR